MKEANRVVGPELTVADLDAAREVMRRLVGVEAEGALYADKIAALAFDANFTLELALLIATERTRRRDGNHPHPRTR